MRKFIKEILSFYKKMMPFYKRMLKVITYITLIIVFIILMAQVTGVNGEYSKLNEMTVLLFFMVSMCNILVKLTEHLTDRIDSRYEYREYWVKELERSTDKADEGKNKNSNEKVESASENSIDIVIDEQRKAEKRDIIVLMLKNNDEINEYFKISKSQAKSSFWFSVISCIVGMGALVIGIYGIVILKDVSVSVISLISGSISELISGTVFWVHNKSALQLNHYYDALHENEKFLSAVNIADKLSAEKREKVLVEIIHKQINSESSKTKTENTKEKRKKKEEDKDS